MPSFRKLNVAEIAALEQPSLGARAQIAREYDAYLSDFAVGDYGRVDLVAGDRRTLVRGRLQAAARRQGLALRFRPGPNPALIFRVETAPPPPVPPVPGSLSTPAARADQPGAAPSRRVPLPPRPPRRRQTPTERYHTVLPRWMREGQQSGRQAGNKRRKQ